MKLLLKHLLMTRSVRFGEFTLASGKKSDFFVDCKQAVLSADGHAAVGKVMLDVISRHYSEAEAVAGVALGGCPLASAVSMASYAADGHNMEGTGRKLPALYVRKAAKDHGTAALVEGRANVPPGSKVVLLEEVVTTGGSSLRAVETLRAAEYEVIGIVALVDREERDPGVFTGANLRFSSVFVRGDLRKDL